MKKNLQSRLAIAIGVMGLMPMCTLMTEASKSYANLLEGKDVSSRILETRMYSADLMNEGQMITHHQRHPRREMY